MRHLLITITLVLAVMYPVLAQTTAPHKEIYVFQKQ